MSANLLCILNYRLRMMWRAKSGARAPLDETKKTETFPFLAPASGNTRHFVIVKMLGNLYPGLAVSEIKYSLPAVCGPLNANWKGS